MVTFIGKSDRNGDTVLLMLGIMGHIPLNMASVVTQIRGGDNVTSVPLNQSLGETRPLPCPYNGSRR